MEVTTYSCPCGSLFTTKTAFYRHRNHSCKNNPNRTRRNKKEMITTPQDIARQHVRKLLQDNQTTLSNPSESIISPVREPLTLSDNLLLKILQNQEQNNKKQEALQAEIIQLKNSLEKKTHQTIFNIDKIQIFITDPIDFVEVLTKRWGSKQKAVNYIKSKINQKVEGDVDLFCNIYMSGEPDTWPISLPDKKNLAYKIAQPNNEVINDPGGIQIHKSFRNAYSNTLLRLSNEELAKTFKYAPDTLEYEAQCDILMDEFDLSLFQDKAQALYAALCEPFVKKLTVRFRILEKSIENTGLFGESK